MDFIRVARARGEGTFYIMRAEILPNMVLPVLTDFGLRFVFVVLLLSGLSFLGLGIQPPAPSWGTDLGKGREFMELGTYQAIFPGLMIMLAVLGFNLLGDGLRDFLDPRIRKSG
jgi:peptide/nickel transport system permease protein